MVCASFCVLVQVVIKLILTVPIIAVFTKYDQFKLNVEMKLEDNGQEDPSSELIEAKAKEWFQADYLDGIAGPVRHVKLESKTALSDGVSMC